MLETNLVSYLQQKASCFTITIRSTEVARYIRQSLLSAPHAASLIKEMSYSSSINMSTGETRIFFNIQYDNYSTLPPTYLVSNELEMMTALSLMYRHHSSIVKIVVDNSKEIITSDNAFSLIERMKKGVDEELQLAQLSRSISSYVSFVGRLVYVYTLQNDYFDTEKSINDMSCIAARHAHNFLSNSNGDPIRVLKMIHEWFRNNVQYRNNHVTADHSAVGLIKNKTGVCQAIAAYAYQLLTFAGIQARYVSGQGKGSRGWGPHAWNMVRLDSMWHHVDFTFELHKMNPTLPRTIEEFRTNHNWDEDCYSPTTSDNYVRTRQALDRSIIIAIPDNPCYSVNGCIVDTSNKSAFCIVYQAKLYIAFHELIVLSGGCYVLIGEVINLYFDKTEYKIPLHSLLLLRDTWYIPVADVRKCGYRVDIIRGQLVLQYVPV